MSAFLEERKPVLPLPSFPLSQKSIDHIVTEQEGVDAGALQVGLVDDIDGRSTNSVAMQGLRTHLDTSTRTNMPSMEHTRNDGLLR